MKKLSLLIAAVLFIPALLLAQSNYKPGYVVTLKGDTVKGFVDYREWDATPLSFSFKKSANDNAVSKYTASDISYCNIDNLESYKSYTGRISTDPTATEKIVYGRDSSFRVGTIFLKVLEQGTKLAFYQYKDDLKVRYFLSEAPDYTPKELIYKLYNDPNFQSNPDPNATKIVTENTYRKQLIAAALKYNELNGKLEAFIAKSDYDGDAILDIVSRINHITKSDYKKNHYAGPVFNIFVGAGLDINTTAPDPGGPYYTAGGTSYTSYGPQGSVGVNLFANPATRRLQFRLEVNVASKKYLSQYMSKVSPYVPTEVSYNELSFSFCPQVVYNFYNADNFKVFAAAGLAFYHSSYSNVYFGSQNHDGSQANLAASNPFLFEAADNAFVLKAGVQFTRNLAIIASYQSSVNNTNGGYFKLSSAGEQISLNYFFR